MTKGRARYLETRKARVAPRVEAALTIAVPVTAPYMKPAARVKAEAGMSARVATAYAAMKMNGPAGPADVAVCSIASIPSLME